MRDSYTRSWTYWCGVASGLAVKAHRGQVDKNGVPYTEHPRAVAELVKGVGPLYEMVALLHDVVEDTPVTLDDLEEEFFAFPWRDKLIAAVDAITRREDEVYFDYIRRCSQNPVATEVKLADLRHNSLPERQTPETEKTVASRYVLAEQILRKEVS